MRNIGIVITRGISIILIVITVVIVVVQLISYSRIRASLPIGSVIGGVPVGGLDRQTDGVISVDGVNISDLSDNKLIDFRKNKIGFVFQSYNLIPVFTAAENVGFIMLLQKKPKKEIENRVQNLLESVGIEEQKDKRPNQMSGGQQQRVAVARALASKPKFVLADEPTANLDSKATTDLLDIMENLNKNEGMTFVFSTHDQRVIDRAHRVVTLEDGKVVSDVIRRKR